jgi:hypothetical protein
MILVVLRLMFSCRHKRSPLLVASRIDLRVALTLLSRNFFWTYFDNVLWQNFIHHPFVVRRRGLSLSTELGHDHRLKQARIPLRR